MKKWKREKSFKDCPRCGMRCLINAHTCSECGLIFSRLEHATNRDAKRKIRRREKEYIIRTGTLPSDVSFLKLLLFCVIGGLFGAHSFYVGRYWRGMIAFASTVTLIVLGCLNAQLIAVMGEVSYGAMSTCIGLFMMLWPTDIVLILMKKYKVPIAIDLNGEYGIELEKQIEASEMTAEEKEVRKEILEDLDKLKQQTAQQDEKHEMSQLSDSENKQKDTKGKKK